MPTDESTQRPMTRQTSNTSTSSSDGASSRCSQFEARRRNFEMSSRWLTDQTLAVSVYTVKAAFTKEKSSKWNSWGVFGENAHYKSRARQSRELSDASSLPVVPYSRHLSENS